MYIMASSDTCDSTPQSCVWLAELFCDSHVVAHAAPSRLLIHRVTIDAREHTQPSAWTRETYQRYTCGSKPHRCFWREEILCARHVWAHAAPIPVLIHRVPIDAREHTEPSA